MSAVLKGMTPGTIRLRQAVCYSQLPVADRNRNNLMKNIPYQVNSDRILGMVHGSLKETKKSMAYLEHGIPVQVSNKMGICHLVAP